MKLVSFENNYIETNDQFDDDEKGIVIKTFIDGFPEKEEDDEIYAEVVATVSTTIHGETYIDWHDNAYRLNKTVKALIEESKAYHQKYLQKYKNTLEKTEVYDTIYQQIENMKTYGVTKNDHQLIYLMDLLQEAINERKAD